MRIAWRFSARWAVPLLASVGVTLACGGGSDPPTADWAGSGVMMVLSAGGVPNIQGVQLLVDGTVVHDLGAGGGGLIQAIVSFDEKLFTSGPHSMTVRITAQVNAPHDYYLNGGLGFVRVGNTQETLSIPCGPFDITMATGDQVICPFTLP